MALNVGQLPGLNINPEWVTAAGFSSGSYNAHFLHVANSSMFKGSGLLNGYLYSTSKDDKLTVNGKAKTAVDQEVASAVIAST